MATRKKTTYGGAFDSNPVTPQNQPIPGREVEMIKNASGGYGFKLEDQQQFIRFLVLGTEGGSYYEDERKLTAQNVESMIRLIKQAPDLVVPTILDVRKRNLALKQSPTIFALALATTFKETRQAALAAVNEICITASQLFEFYAVLKDIGGDNSNRSLRNALANWYKARDAKSLGYQAIKYRNRNGISHADMIRISHPSSPDQDVQAVLAWILRREMSGENESASPEFMERFRRVDADAKRAVERNEQLFAFEELQLAKNAATAAKLIAKYKLPREAVPTQFLNDKEVWAALAESMPYTALVRNLNKMTAVGLIGAFGNGTWKDKLVDQNVIVKSRVHPLRILMASKQYAAGHGDRGSLTWTPNGNIISALDDAFAIAMTHNIDPITENVAVAIDVSGSMHGARVSGLDNMLSVEAAAVLAVCYLRANPNTLVFGVDTRIHNLPINASTSINDAMAIALKYGGGGTNLGEAFNHVKKNLPEADGVLMVTDNESWYGNAHVSQEKHAAKKALRWVNVETSANQASVVDPRDRDSLSLCGFSADVMTITNLFMSRQI